MRHGAGDSSLCEDEGLDLSFSVSVDGSGAPIGSSDVPIGSAGSPRFVFVSAVSILGALSYGNALLSSGRSGWNCGHRVSALEELLLGLDELRGALVSLRANPRLAPEVRTTPAELEQHVVLCFGDDLMFQVTRKDVLVAR